ncbi:MAG: hypothetical protein KDD44_09190, partial [Bdellovibrionales bacterium]|nr:hypothetical protein [Bdellovibrionales bacterium]
MLQTVRTFLNAAIFGVIFLTGTTPMAGAEVAPTGTASAEHPLKQLEEGVRQFELSNGMRVVLYSRPMTP